MIKAPNLSRKDILLLQCKAVVIRGTSSKSKLAFEVLRYFQINVIAFYDNSSTKKRYCGIPVINDNIFDLYTNEKKGIAIIPVNNELIEKTAENRPFDSLTVENISRSFSFLIYSQKLKKPILYSVNALVWKLNCMRRYNIEYIALNIRKPSVPLFVCLPMKTADHTLYYTFDSINSNVSSHCAWFDVKTDRHKATLLSKLKKSLYYLADSLFTSKEIDYANLIHKPRIIKQKKLNQKSNTIKIITATRDPISQNLSVLFQEMPVMGSVKNWLLNELYHTSYKSRKSCVDRWVDVYLENGNDIQKWFDLYVMQYFLKKNISLYIPHERFIQRFMLEFTQYILDITQYPFDKEKGYTIIKKGNVEVFVYQLEKLNNLVPELSNFVGVPFYKLENANQAEDKWIAESYRRAQQEIEITQEYFDKCFDEPYVKHCYSEADIEKFKARWRVHIKNKI